MKKKLNPKELESISGGFLLRASDGTYVMYGMPSETGEIPFVGVCFGKDFHLAVEYDWKWFEDVYRKRGICDIDQLEAYYKERFGD